jgi:thiamine-monophosphate kinase
MKLDDLGEFEFIRRVTAGRVLEGGHVFLDLGDDAAGWRTLPGEGNLLTTDMLVEGTHFRLSDGSPGQLGHKALAVNLSDIAAVGGRPLDAYLTLGIPPDRLDALFMDQFYQGFNRLADEWRVNLLGGDTTRSPLLIISVTLTGTIDPEKAIRRSGAKKGDTIFLTGTIGDAAAGLELLQTRRHLSEPFAGTLVRAHLEPQPHLRAASILADSEAVSAMIDVSDGLIQDLGHICLAASAGAEILADRLPVSGAARSYAGLTGWVLPDEALRGGEDYCLLFTASAESEDIIRRPFDEAGLALYSIGKMTDSAEITLISEGEKKRLSFRGGWDHFRTSRHGPSDA